VTYLVGMARRSFPVRVTQDPQRSQELQVQFMDFWGRPFSRVLTPEMVQPSKEPDSETGSVSRTLDVKFAPDQAKCEALKFSPECVRDSYLFERMMAGQTFDARADWPSIIDQKKRPKK
ncbi:MAG: hypothetical protein Q8P67_21955, partial [archaeon]|nr:hypothetical protein [archaeon]